ncbi:glycosyltransferase family 2 protein [uncultured Aeromicrobium sp.]|uniref:glycosyltransferase family 2 protein n=1 Tax=uncultured Aeromicrobium sp. TaxID=337820 RepID=UPI0025E85753|nr:glycosyltransferase family 2 protein [uncultured Aeromicrobium sp.]
MTQIFAAVVNYNSSKELSSCIASLRAARIARVYVLDNASAPDDRRRLAAYDADPFVSVTYSAVNLGFGGGVNRLAELIAEEHGTHDTLLWVVNPDSTVEDDAGALLAHAVLNDECDVVAPLLLTGDGAVWFAGGHVNWRTGESRHWHYHASPTSVPSAPFTTSFMSGANFMLPLDTWRLIGGYDERLFLYWEDADWSSRAIAAGCVMKIIPAARGAHTQGASSGGGLSPTYYYYAQRNRLLLASKHGCSPYGVAFGRGLAETLRLTVRPILARDWKSLVRGLDGLVDGLRTVEGPRATWER